MNVLEYSNRWFRRSPYAKPTIYFFAFFLVSALTVWIFELHVNDEFISFSDGVWWSIITLSTTGYGDKVPITFIGRVIAVLTILIGVGGTSLLSGALASWLVDRNTKARRGLMEYKKLKDHLVICGWKEDMKNILRDILWVTPDLTSDSLVLISNVDSERMEELKEDDELRGLKFVRGDYFSEAALRRASVETWVITIKSIARDAYVTAEVLDRKYESYLRHAMCDEIMFSRDLSRQMLANTSATNGMSHIIQDLLSQSGGTCRLTTEPVAETHVSKPYGDLKSHLQTGSRVLLGILENTGSPNRMKVEALREAQKTSDVSTLINNLQRVKGLEVNRPMFLPADDYVIQRYTQAIVLERT